NNKSGGSTPLADMILPSTVSSIVGWNGSFVSMLAVWRNGPLSALAAHWTRALVDSPGAIADSLTSESVHLQLVVPLRNLSGASPTFVITNSWLFDVPRCIVPKS